ncbi:hypothetical protein WN943_001967 [Citrus x changshan-huyou]
MHTLEKKLKKVVVAPPNAANPFYPQSPPPTPTGSVASTYKFVATAYRSTAPCLHITNYPSGEACGTRTASSTMWDTIVAYLSSDWATSPLKIDCIRSSILPLEMGNRPRGPSDFSNGKGRDSRYFSFSHNGAGMQRYTPCSFLMLTCNGNTLGPYLPHARVYGWPSN